MNSIITLSEEVVDFLSDYDAVLSYAPDFTAEQIKSRKVLVVPAGEKKEISSRLSNRHEYTLSIGVIQKIKKSSEISDSVQLVEEISHKLLRSVITGFTCTEIEFNPLFSIEDIRGKNQFIGVLNCVFTGENCVSWRNTNE